MTQDERELLVSLGAAGTAGILRKLMDPAERKLVRCLVRRGWVEKGRSRDRQGSVVYFLDPSGREAL